MGLQMLETQPLQCHIDTKTLQIVQAQLFGMSQPNANRYIRRLLPMLVDASIS